MCIYKFKEFEVALNKAFTLINQASFKFQSSAFLEMTVTAACLMEIQVEMRNEFRIDQSSC